MDVTKLGEVLKSSALSFLLLVAVYGRLWLHPRLHFPGSAHLLAIAGIFLLGTRLSASLRPSFNIEGASLALIVVHLLPQQMAASPFYSSEALWLFLSVSFLLSTLIATIFSNYPRTRVCFLAGICLLTLGSAFVGFYLTSAGRTLFSDDHPAFLYRLQQLKESFPSVPFYNPSWNGGVEAREFFPSGALGLFLLWAPVIYLVDVWSNYNLIVVGTLFGIVPALLSIATLHQSRSVPAAFAAAVLSVAASTMWYRWALSYGTLPFILSMAAFPVVLATCRCFLEREEDFSRRSAILLFLGGSLTIFWTLSGLVLIPLLLGVLLYSFLWRRRGELWRMSEKNWSSGAKFLSASLLLLCSHLPWILLFLSASNVLGFLSIVPGGESTSQGATHAVHAASFKSPMVQKHGLTHGSVMLAREFIRSVNPLLLLFAIPAMVRLGSTARWLTGLTLLGSVTLAVLGPIIKPQLELQRFWLLGMTILIPIVAELIAEIFERAERSTRFNLLPTMVTSSLLLVAPVWIWRVVTNSSAEKYHFERPSVRQLAEAISAHAGLGRAVFSGFVLHELSNGHLAPLAIRTKVPMVASSYQHDKWKYTELIPPDFMARGRVGVARYLDLMNATVVIAHHPYWKRWFRDHKKAYSQIATVGPFVLFQRINFVPSYFESGSGKILEQSSSGIRLIPETESVTVRFNYLPLLVTSGCELGSEKVGATLSLIRLTRCLPGQEVTISMKSPLRRIFGLIEVGKRMKILRSRIFQ